MDGEGKTCRFRTVLICHGIHDAWERRNLQFSTEYKFSIFARMMNGCIYSGVAPQRMVIRKHFMELNHN
jgi:hypothetical protein